jgi:3-oxoacyl-[acyl-carrier protein] reductase
MEVPMSTHLSDKVAFVTGGSRGIGAAIVQRLAREGAAVAFTFNASAAQAQAQAKAIIEAGGRALAIRADVGDATALVKAIDQAAHHFGKIDILVNGAGIMLFAAVEDFSIEDFDRTLDINVRAVFVASKAVLPHMGAGGRVITIGSVVADRMPFPGGAPYSMSKSALTGLTKGLARDLGPRGITVNLVQPGPIDTDMNPETAEFAAAQHAVMAVPRHGKPEEVAGLVAYLASPDAAFVTGASLMIDGGFSA